MAEKRKKLFKEVMWTELQTKKLRRTKSKLPVIGTHGIFTDPKPEENPVVVSDPSAGYPVVAIGDRVTRRAITLSSDPENGRFYTGRVVYIHPRNRYHTVAFMTKGGGELRESFIGIGKTEV